MAIVIGISGCLRCIYMICFLPISNGFQLAFFRYADRQKPHFYLTADEINNAMKTDEIWKKEAEAIRLCELLEWHQEDMPDQSGLKGLSLDTFNQLCRYKFK